jgi:hypothetical protein
LLFLSRLSSTKKQLVNDGSDDVSNFHNIPDSIQQLGILDTHNSHYGESTVSVSEIGQSSLGVEQACRLQVSQMWSQISIDGLDPAEAEALMVRPSYCRE